MEETAKDVMEHLKVLSNLPKDATKQKAKKAEELKAREVKYGTQTNDLLTQNYEGGDVAAYGAAVGQMVFGAFSRNMDDVRNNFKEERSRSRLQSARGT
jgi:hypothetical protein